MRKRKYKDIFERIIFDNRWKQPKWSRSGEWVIFGFGKRFFSPEFYEYYFNFFGLNIRFWFNRKYKQ